MFATCFLVPLGKGRSWGARVPSEEVVSGGCKQSSLWKLREEGNPSMVHGFPESWEDSGS